jgi:guanyl-specific ribonuclease Sa
VDTHVGNISGFDPNDPQGTGQYHFIFVDGNGSRDNQLFNLASNGSLSSATIFDYEALVQELGDANLTIRVRVSDSENLFFEGSLLVTVINAVEDFDQDGIEDSIDPDDDNDGFTDIFETQLGTDPLNPASIPNQAPTSLALSSLKFTENLPPYSMIGELNASDPDKGATFRYQLITGKGSKDNPLFRIDSNGSLSTATPFDFETNASTYSIRVQLSDEWNATLEQVFTLELIDIDEKPPTLTLLGDASITIITGSSFIDPGARWTDDRDGNGTAYAPMSDYNTTQAGTYLLHYRYQDQAGNPAKEVQRTLIVKDPTLPLVRTRPAQLEQNQSLQVQAELLSSGGLDLVEIGIELGQRPSLSDGTLYPFEYASDSNGTFSSYVEKFPIGEVLYYRAYAINSLGITHGATRMISLAHNQDPTTWWSGATIHEGGWRTLDWFGSFLLTAEDRWVYHADLGWVYLLSDQQNGLWIWKEGLGWVWTSEASAPFYWKDSSTDWLYPLLLRPTRQIFWDYSTQQAVHLF